MRKAAPLLLLAGCSSSPAIVGVEDLGDAELRVVVARTDRTSDVRLLAIDTPYRYEQEALSTVFERGDTLDVFVFGFRTADLITAFPSFEGSNAADLVAQLTPSLDTDAPGVFGPPEPTRVLRAIVDESSGGELSYAAIEWSVAQTLDEAAFGFALGGDTACPPIDRPFRVWRRGRPQSTCVFARDAGCQWARTDGGTCPNAVAVFGVDAAVRQRPDGRLTFGQQVCEPVTPQNAAPRFGETSAWDCGGFVVAAQEPTAFEVGREAMLAAAEIDMPSTYGPGRPGMYFGADADQVGLLRRVSVEGGVPSLQNVETPIIDRPMGDDRPAMSTDGSTVSLSAGTFATVVGAVPEAQCFRTIVDGRQGASAILRRKRDDRTLDLEPGLGPVAETTAWDIVGDPGAGFVASPTNVELRLPLALGRLERVTVRRRTDPITLVAHGSGATYLMAQVTRFPNDLNNFGCGQPIAHPGGITGDIVIGTTGVYALVVDGVAVLDERDGTELRRFTDGNVRFDATFRIGTAAGASAERVVVDDGAGRAWLFDSETGAVTTVEVDGEILAVVDGPRVVYRPRTSAYELVTRSLDGTEVTYVVPPTNERSTSSLSATGNAVLEIGARLFVGYSADGEAGVVDLTTGLSIAVPAVAGASVRSVFADESEQETWFAVQTGTTLRLIEVR